MTKPKREPRDDLDELLNGAVEVAAELLEADGEFEPFALALKVDGEILQFEPDPPEGATEELDDEAVVSSLREALKDRRAELVAIAIAADVTLEDESGSATSAAIAVSLEHRGADPISCYVPYEIGEEGVSLSELVGEAGERHVFPSTAVH